MKGLTCVFPLLANGTWNKGEPHADVKAAKLSMRFDTINTEEGTARVTDAFGHFEIIARLSTDTLHLMQSFSAGPLYVTTVFNIESRGGKLKAVHARHELTDAVLPGFTSSPERSYGECESTRNHRRDNQRRCLHKYSRPDHRGPSGAPDSAMVDDAIERLVFLAKIEAGLAE